MVRIMVVDDEQLRHQGVRMLLDRARTMSDRGSPVFSHADLPSEHFSDNRPHLLVVSPRSDEVLVLEQARNGTRGYFLKQGLHQALDSAIQSATQRLAA